MSHYAYDKRAAVDQVVCEKCGDELERPYAYCVRHRAQLKADIEAILAPRPYVREMVNGRRAAPDADNKVKVRHESRRYWRYGLTFEQFDRIKKAQNDKCGICGVSGKEKKLHIDHDHSCCPPGAQSCGACVRGLLCVRCNTRLAVIEDDVFTMNAERYLQKSPAKKALLK